VEVERPKIMVERRIWGWSFLKLINLVLKKLNPKTSKKNGWIRGWKWLGEVETEQSVVKKESMELLDKDKSSMETDRASNKTIKTFKKKNPQKRRKRMGEGGRREWRERGRSMAAWDKRWDGFFRREGRALFFY
jgi:hypothetical protein